MNRVFAIAGLLLVSAGLLGAAEMSPERIDALVTLFDPNTKVDIQNAFTAPASEISEMVKDATWFASLMFAPFLVLPIVLLLYVVFKFRDRGDGRKPATFIHNDKLEIFWTAVPILVVIVVAIPITKLIYVTDLPPENAALRDPLKLEVIGKQFQWKYKLHDYGVEMGWDDDRQQPIVLQKDRLTTLYFTSEDVNHAWAVPAFGVKKDCFPAPRYNYAWFTPNRVGYYDGQCYELCGENHGKMVLSAVVAEEEDFEAWIDFQHHRLDAKDVAAALRATDGSADAQGELEAALATYFAEDRSTERIDSLNYWAAYSYNLSAGDAEVEGDTSVAQAIRDAADEQLPVLRNLIADTLASPPPAQESPEPAPADTNDDEAAAAPADQAADQEG